MRLIIVRHAQTTLNRDGIIQGVSSGDLTDKGKKQAELLAKRLMKEKVDVVYSSDYKRCKDTLNPFLKMKKVPVHFVEELRERNYGIMDGKSGEEYDKWKQDKDWTNFDFRMSGGESYNDVLKRVKKFLDVLLKKENGKTVLIMAHGGTKRAILMNLFEEKNRDYYKKTSGQISKNTAMTIIGLEKKGGWKADSWYSVEHLEDL
ncbi:hypothetical protein COU62_00465 [Candidatus Pacearchaeota archaeon CG10_big_fil_rev_8_21_14_0_10_35_219]|nr:histidine phosphatase family protein [Candidatus Pacearchaeota archaeon]OIO42711.1 MAG: hypothetical protein AUJ63_02260 [Candidatus Pacearchaeota archaeon CG1_02_35_32]PIO08263.1 MAG: hypothetical protein COU62_00465 [Candidatus Pacearchaeota archaeon CG10_big_fil_rev_8_21_14_0_10_35_219]PIY81864.1 MAG: hypothetical protein COY79_00205 [Candidatus Pacearchaeota archaeon CG_4_10_14_0_8_um_filter_35_169]PIZ79395.1 MAG: hypothetical protein COY00_04430 [Candidatus Pacearchaeota archaeon CG_4_1